MTHCIIVKWNESVTDKAAVRSAVKLAFSAAPEIPGVKSVKLVDNCIDRPNRYDIAILLEMDREALPLWDASDVHKNWKKGFGDKIASKAIFDFE